MDSKHLLQSLHSYTRSGRHVPISVLICTPDRDVKQTREPKPVLYRLMYKSTRGMLMNYNVNEGPSSSLPSLLWMCHLTVMQMDTQSNLNIHALSSQGAVDFTVIKPK